MPDMRKILAATAAAVIAGAGIAWAAQQIAVDPFRKLLAVEILPATVPPNAEFGNVSLTTTTPASVLAAAGSGTRNCITGGLIANSSGTTDSLITFEDGNGGSTLATTVAPGKNGMGGSNFSLPTPICGSANTAVYVAAGTGVTTIYVTLVGFKGS